MLIHRQWHDWANTTRNDNNDEHLAHNNKKCIEVKNMDSSYDCNANGDDNGKIQNIFSQQTTSWLNGCTRRTLVGLCRWKTTQIRSSRPTKAYLCLRWASQWTLCKKIVEYICTQSMCWNTSNTKEKSHCKIGSVRTTSTYLWLISQS